MTDIFSIKDISLWIPISFLYTTIVIIIFILLYFLLIKKKKKTIVINTELVKEEKTDYKSLIKSFPYKSLDSASFLRDISLLFRSYIEDDLQIWDFSKLTFIEIEKLFIDNKYKNTIKDIYFKEYKEEELTEEEKEKIYKNIKSIILKDKNANT